jgi:ribosomal protein L11 methyltransferase
VSWLTLSVRAEADYAEALSEALLARGALSVDMLDADADTPDEQAIFGEPGEPTSAVWQHNLVNALFESDADVAGILQSSCTELGIATLPEHHIASLEESDWVRLTQAQFDPIRISQRLWIVPTWHTPSDPTAINIVLDPGLAFGTGSHPTTRLCLRWLDENIKRGETVLDYGCGSGILAIAAMKLGAGSATGVDVDAQAVIASRDNALANQVLADFYLPEACPELGRRGITLSQYDVVVANILTNPLRALAPLLAGATTTGGRIVLSGILAEQAEEVMRIYAQWFDLAPAVLEDGWCCLSGMKK